MIDQRVILSTTTSATTRDQELLSLSHFDQGPTICVRALIKRFGEPFEVCASGCYTIEYLTNSRALDRHSFVLNLISEKDPNEYFTKACM